MYIDNRLILPEGSDVVNRYDIYNIYPTNNNKTMKKIAVIIAIVLCVALNGCNKEDDMSKLDEGGKILYSLELKIVDKNGAEIIAQDGGIDKIKDLVSIEYKGKEYSPQELSTNPYVRPKMNPVFSIMPNEQSPRYLCFGLFSLQSIKSNVWFTIKWKDGSKDVVEITESSGKVEFYVNGVIDKEVSKEIVGAVVTKKIE